MNLRKLCFGVMLCGLASVAVSAHHSNASYYDTVKTVTITGTLKKVEWRSPHVFFSVDVKDANGAVTTYGLEHASPQSLYRAGFRKDDVAIGSVVEVDIMPGLRDHTTGRMRVMRFNGKKFFEMGLDRPGLTE